MKLRVLDLFSGIGGFSLGLERTGGFETVAFCEIEEFPRRVLAKHWPEVPCYHDVRTLTADVLRRDGISVDVICGGFPCQDISLAGEGAGLAGERSGLWSEIARLVSEIRPGFVFVENVSALLSRGFDRVLGDLAALGYDAEWHCIRASDIGAQHHRDRIWILAYPEHAGVPVGRGIVSSFAESFQRGRIHLDVKESRGEQASEILAYAVDAGPQGAEQPFLHTEQLIEGSERSPWAIAECGSLPHWRDWAFEPSVGRVANGIPDRAHRLKGLGNAVVPQIPELIGHAILESMKRENCGDAA